mmetsp:Transcript_17636/g.50782  ORF Transcript_17636/g.50782 Transcript_17636/m.50782 type:complete len:685 (+) Transcript_17636:57-2111(+)|eukprot:CAMPEP_0176054410 /NCGR_PEP_ID=MMETSP0120_2-20121206/27071_1 /TAXON_ID=160619 /ORGANISM="Kryptoperidinium foliaceum, Strain CCMP 1326" /LENGTH=684 /DNA_ID=CAMNT_0017387875 /DNA_START=34 /DNA_END=2088 /DNA_ORIENTATION=+
MALRKGTLGMLPFGVAVLSGMSLTWPSAMGDIAVLSEEKVSSAAAPPRRLGEEVEEGEKESEEKVMTDEEEGEDGNEEGEEGEEGRDVEENKEGEEGKESEEGAEGAEGEEGEEGEESVSPTDFSCAAMLLGGVSFVMAIFTVVNWEDDDVRRYAWNVISNTVSIFMAVLLFQGNREVLNKIVAEKAGSKMKVLIHLAHCLLYLYLLLAVIAWVAGIRKGQEFVQYLNSEEWVISDASLANCGDVVTDVNSVRAVQRQKQQQEAGMVSSPTGTDSKHDPKHSVITVKGMEIAVTKKRHNLETAKQDLQCWATLLAHCAGFAAIYAGATMQQSPYFSGSAFLSFIPVPIMVGILLLFFLPSNYVRKGLREKAAAEKRAGVRAKLVHEFCDEAEKDVLALTISFLSVQSVRYFITGQLPNAEGLEEPLKVTISMNHATSLWICGFAFMGIATVFPWIRAWLDKKKAEAHGGAHIAPVEHSEGHGQGEEHEEHEESLADKILASVMDALAMMFAWCLMWGSRYAWMATEFMGLNVMAISARIILALGLSFFAFLVTLCLDKVADSVKDKVADSAKSSGEQGGEKAKIADQLVNTIVASIALMVGFIWEHSFDGAVTDVSMLSRDHPRTMKFVLGLLIVAMVIYPWKQFILKKSLQLKELKKHRDQAQKKKAQREAKDKHQQALAGHA